MYWPSGAGGDFLIGLLHSISPFSNVESVGLNTLTNQWDVYVPEYERPFETDDINEITDYIHKIGTNDIGMLHPEQYLQPDVNKVVDSLDDCVTINVYEDDPIAKIYINSLYSIKCRTSKSISRKYCYSEDMQPVTGTEKFNYRDIFIDCNPHIIKKFLSKFGRYDYDIDEVINCIQLYTQLNYEILYYKYPESLAVKREDWRSIAKYVSKFESLNELAEIVKSSIHKYQSREYV